MVLSSNRKFHLTLMPNLQLNECLVSFDLHASSLVKKKRTKWNGILKFNLDRWEIPEDIKFSNES